MLFFYILAAILLGVLIIVHEIGHFVAARAAGVTVERFSVGFGKRLVSIRRGDTEYAISAFPLGGYVKMAGMEASEDAAQDGRTDTFLSKPPGIRAVIVAAGPVANFLWAVLVSFVLLWVTGLATLGEPVIGRVDPESAAASAGLVAGDRIVEVDGEAVESWDEVLDRAGREERDEVSFRVLGPDGATRAVDLPLARDPETGYVDLGLRAHVPSSIGVVMSGSPADVAGLETGDVVVSIEGVEVSSWDDLGDIIYDRAGVPLEFVWRRGDETFSATIVPEEGQTPDGETGVRTVGLIGIMRPWGVRRLTGWQALARGFQAVITDIRLIALFLWGLVTGGVGAGAVGGPIRMVQLASESARWGADYFFWFMSYLSVNLFLLNLLPLPILDGGHLVLLGLEKVRKKTLTTRQLMVWQQIGFLFFGVLTVVLLVLDLLRVR